MSKQRCGWLNDAPLYIRYHDEEWGVPVHDDQKMFEFLLLETFQAGLSWFTILRKRENFRQAFDNFDYQKIATYDAAKLEELMQNPGIIRNRQKINAAVNNARQFLEVQNTEGSFCNYLWKFVDGEPVQNQWQSLKEVPATTSLSDSISKDLKKKGFKFVGSTTTYAHMQACGMVNDHTTDCFRHSQLQKTGKS